MNKVILVGNLCRDVEAEKVGKGKNKVSRVWNTLAIRRDSETTDFIPFTILGKGAEILEEYASKGDKILIEGRLETYTNDDNKTIISVLANNIELCGGKK